MSGTERCDEILRMIDEVLGTDEQQAIGRAKRRDRYWRAE